MKSLLKRNSAVLNDGATTGTEYAEHKALRRIPMEYVPSIDNYDDDNDADENYEAKKGVKFTGQAKQNRRYRGYEKLGAETRSKVDAQLVDIQSNLRRRAIKPVDDNEYNRLREAEQSKADENGPAAMTIFHKTAKPDGTYEVNEFADLLSSVHKGVQQNQQFVGSLHEHEARETKLYQMKHFDAHTKEFAENPMFSCALFKDSDAPLCTLMQMSQYDACETSLDKFRRKYPTAVTRKFGEFVHHFFEECGLHLFCVYVSSTAPGTLFAAFEMDGVRRYFVTLVFSLKSGDDIMVKARKWCDETLERYKELMLDWQTGVHTFKPCTDMEKNASFWALYDITMSKELQNEDFTFQYAYYSACQCVQLEIKQDTKL